MKIKVGLYGKNEKYIENLAESLEGKYYSRLQVACFTDVDSANDAEHEDHFDVFLVDEDAGVEKDAFLFPSEFVLLSEQASEGSRKGYKHSIFKYQMTDRIFSQIIDIYNPKTGAASDVHQNENTKLIWVSSVSGGVGTTCFAVALALYYAGFNNKVLYLSTDPFECVQNVFNSEGGNNFSDVAYCVKSKKKGLGLRLESMLHSMNNKLFFFAPASTCFDTAEMTEDNWLTLLDTIRGEMNFDVVIVDSPMDVGKTGREYARRADRIVLINDGSEQSNSKLEIMYRSMRRRSSEEDRNMFAKMCLVYNKFSDKNCQMLNISEVPCIGGIGRLDRASLKQVINYIVGQQSVLTKI